jgi:hypothetical protein
MNEISQLHEAILIHMKNWSRLELSLSTLMFALLSTKGPNQSHIPYVIYYSPDGFDARQKIVDRVIRQFILENTACIPIAPHWNTINEQLGDARQIRNKVAHGAPLILCIRGKDYVRHCPPAFDINRLGNLIPKGTIPGLSIDDIRQANRIILKLIECIDSTSRAIGSFRKRGPASLKKRLAELIICLQKLQGHHSNDQNSEERPDPHPPFFHL